MQLITSPSKTQRFNGRTHAVHSLPLLLDRATTLIKKLKSMDREALAQLMKTSDRLTESTYHLIGNLALPFSPENAKQALFTFQGDAYSAINAANYTSAQLHHAQEHLFILSGLYGILRPLDLMQPYRLEMGYPLAVGGADNLYQFWRDQVTRIISQAMERDGDKILIDLASKEYSKVVNQRKLPGKMCTVIFKQYHKGRLRIIPIHAKRARGMMVDYIIARQIADAEELKGFAADGYAFSSRESTPTDWIFMKTG